MNIPVFNHWKNLTFSWSYRTCFLSEKLKNSFFFFFFPHSPSVTRRRSHGVSVGAHGWVEFVILWTVQVWGLCCVKWSKGEVWRFGGSNERLAWLRIQSHVDVVFGQVFVALARRGAGGLERVHRDLWHSGILRICGGTVTAGKVCWGDVCGRKAFFTKALETWRPHQRVNVCSVSLRIPKGG